MVSGPAGPVVVKTLVKTRTVMVVGAQGIRIQNFILFRAGIHQSPANTSKIMSIMAQIGTAVFVAG